jgi:hypothetical protein
MERAALRTECKKLAKFIRLTEFQMNDTLVDLAYNSARMLCDAVNPAVKPPRDVRVEEVKEKDIVINTKNATKPVLPLFSVCAELDMNGPMLPPLSELGKQPPPKDGDEESEEEEEEEADDDKEPVKATSTCTRPRPRVVLTPSYQVFVDTLEQTICEGVGLLTASERLTTHEELAPYTQVANKEGDVEGGGGGGGDSGAE